VVTTSFSTRQRISGDAPTSVLCGLFKQNMNGDGLIARNAR
jgi:hypothetical protein